MVETSANTTTKSLSGKRCLLLDMDGTLLDLAFDNHFWTETFPQAVAHRHGWSITKTHEHVSATLQAAQGSLAWYCFDHWSAHFSVDVTALTRERSAQIKMIEGAAQFLSDARAAGFSLPLVTNAHPDAIAIKHDQTGVLDLVDRVYSAHDAGFPKEDPAFWRWLRRQSGVEWASAVMIDDSLAVLRTASEFVDVIAIAAPDSRHPERDMRPFPAVSRISALTPALRGI